MSEARARTEATVRPLPFSLELGRGTGRLTATDFTLSPFFHLTQLSLDLPHIHFPGSVGSGGAGFRHHRSRLVCCEARVSLSELQTSLAARLEREETAFRDVRVRSRGGEIVVSASLACEGHTAFGVWRGRVVPAGERGVDALLLSFYDLRLTGWFPRSALELTGDLLSMAPGDFVRSRGLTSVLLSPLRPLLKELLVSRGWKLPQCGEAVLAIAAVEDDGLRFRFGQHGSSDEEVVSAEQIGDEWERESFERFVHDLEHKRHHARLDALVFDGALDAAVREILRLEDKGEASPFLDDRLLLLLVSRKETVHAARERAEERLRRDPRDPVALSVLAAAHEGEDDLSRAVSAYARLADVCDPVRQRPELSHCLMRCAEIHQSLGETEGAMGCLGRLLDHEPDDVAALVALARLMDSANENGRAAELRKRILALGGSSESQREAAYALAWYHVRAQQSEDARPFLHLLKREELGSDEMLRLEAALGALDGNWNAAESALRQLLDVALEGDDEARATELAFELSRVLVDELDRPQESALAILLVDERFGENPHRTVRVAELLRRGGDAERARRLEEEALERLDRHGDADSGLRVRVHTRLAVDYGARPETRPRARSHFGRALDLDKVALDALDGLESLVENSEHWDDLAARLHDALDAAGDGDQKADLALRLALIYAGTFDFPDQAIPLFECCLDLRPSERFALRHLVELTRRTGAWEHHRSALERLLLVAGERKERVAVRMALAEVEGDRLGRPREAREHLESLLRESPRDPEALVRLAHVLRALGEHEELAGVLRRQAALSVEPDRQRDFLLELAVLQLDTLHRRAEAEATFREARSLCGDEDPRQRTLEWRLRVDEVGTSESDSLETQEPRGTTPAPRGSVDAGRVEISEDERVALHAELRGVSHIARRGAGVGWQPTSASERWFHALALADKGDKEEATAILRTSLAQDPEHRASWELYGMLLDEHADPEERAAVALALGQEVPAPASPSPSVEEPTAVRTADPARADALLEQALEDKASGRCEEALVKARASLDADANAIGALDLLLEILEPGPERADVLARRAELAWSADEAARLTKQAAEALAAEGETSRSEQFRRRYLRWEPLDEEAAQALSDAYRESARWTELRSLLEERVEALDRIRVGGGDDAVGVSVSLVRTELASFHEDQGGDPAISISILQRARRDWPRNDEALERLAGLLEQQRDWVPLADVLEALVGVLEDRPSRMSRLKQLVELYRGPLADPVAARETLRVALREMPEEEAARLRAMLEA